jgi:hypothetical protein
MHLTVALQHMPQGASNPRQMWKGWNPCVLYFTSVFSCYCTGAPKYQGVRTLDGKLNEICRMAMGERRLDLWSSFDDLLRSLVTVLLEIFHKQRTQFCHFPFEVGTASPALRGVQHLGRNAGACLWHM